ncbi:flippase [Leuconostoc gasicomitatum]|uniref:flippase n=1 Tax=Leuconostoc gasicomitatum TaxID=115778 RepID=UPI001CC74D3A|nr:flippase [Leuconostoc gasicomitatum]MBZ5950158.1 flippase [Leuconostoc gasicomitatum]
MKILKNYFYNMAYQILLLIVPLLTMPYISRTLGPQGLGTYSYTNSIMSYFVLLGNLGITLYGSRQIAYVQSDKIERSKLFWEITILKLVTVGFATLMLVLFLMYYSEYRFLIIAQSLTLIASAFDVSWYFMGVEDFKKTVLRNILIKIASLILIFTLVHSESDIIIYIVILSGSTLVGNIMLIPFLIKQINFFNIKKLNIWKHLSPVIFLFLPQMATQIYLVVNKTMLGQMDSIKAVGFFSSSDTLIRLALTIVSSLSAVLMPRISNLIARGEMNKVEKYMGKSFEFINFLSLPIMLGLIAISPKFIPLFLGENFKVVSTLIIIESPVVLLISWSIAITNQYLIPAKMNKAYINSTVIGAISNVLINIVMIRFYGVYGAIIATLISEILVMSYLVMIMMKFLSVKEMIFSNFYKYGIASVIMFLFTIVIDKLLSTTIYSVLLEVFLSIMIYFIALLILKVRLLTNWRHFFDD